MFDYDEATKNIVENDKEFQEEFFNLKLLDNLALHDLLEGSKNIIFGTESDRIVYRNKMILASERLKRKVNKRIKY